MLDGRNSIVWTGCALSLFVAACGGTGDVGSVVSDEPAAVSTPDPTSEELPDESTNTLDPTVGDDAPDYPDQPTLGTCDGPNPPARCTADPATFNAYGLAGIISSLEVLRDASCCVDFNDDESADNALGEGFAAIGKLDDLNRELSASLVSGAQSILLEAEGLDDLENDDHFALLVYSAQPAESSAADEVMLDPSSIARGVAPLFTFDEARLEEGRLEAIHGEFEVEASFNGVLLKPVVHDVQVRADLDPTADGLVLRNGEIGGRIELQHLFGEMNAVAEGCDCLGLEAALVRGAVGEASCETPDTSACDAEGREVCSALVEVCPVLELIATNIADVDSDADGVNESISLGALFETRSARIAGVAR